MQQQHSEIHTLLTDAFEGWGSDDYFHWKYTQYPNYDPTADNFTITNDTGEIVAARRVFRHRLHTPAGDRLSVDIHGGTAVDEEYRGRGYYTTLLKESMEMSERESNIVLTFNRAGKITTEHHKKNGWNWVQLPIYVSVISPSRVFSHYMASNGVVEKTTRYLSSVDRKLTSNSIVSRSLATLIGSLYGAGDETDHRTGSEPPNPDSTIATNGSAADGGTVSPPDYEISRLDGPVPETVVKELYDRLQMYLPESYHFDRSVERMKHCVLYPESTVFVAREAETGAVLDFVVAGTLDKDGLTECRVVEQTWSNPAITRQLFGAVEGYGRETGVDVVVTCSRTEPGPRWVPMGTEYMMWPAANGRQLPTTAADWRITLYDVL